MFVVIDFITYIFLDTLPRLKANILTFLIYLLIIDMEFL